MIYTGIYIYTYIYMDTYVRLGSMTATHCRILYAATHYTSPHGPNVTVKPTPKMPYDQSLTPWAPSMGP